MRLMNSEELVIGLLINLIVGVGVGWGFYKLGVRQSSQQADDL